MSDLFPDARRAADFDEVDDEQGQRRPGVLEAAVAGSEGKRGGAGGDELPPSPGQAPLTPVGSAAAGPVFSPAQARGELIRPGATERVRATWGWRGFWARLGLRLQPGRKEQAHLDEERVIRQATWSRAVNILVANKTGSVGKTTTSLVLGGTLARVRGGGVCVFEVTDDVGALEKRAEGSPTHGLGDLVPVADQVASKGELAGFAAPQTSHAHVIGTVGDRAELRADDVHTVRRLLDRHYDQTVADSANNTKSPAFRAAVATADQLVVPTLPTSVALIDALSVLEAVSRSGPAGQELAATAVVVINHDGKPEDRADAGRVREQLAEMVQRVPTVAVLEVPYDAHIGKAGEISIGSLTRESTVAWTKVAAEVTRRLVNTHTTIEPKAAGGE